MLVINAITIDSKGVVMITKKTYGQNLIAHWDKNIDVEDDVAEYGRQAGTDIMKDVYEVVEKAKLVDIYKNRDFYVVMLINKDRMGDTPRVRVFARRSCPTPVYKQSVWKSHALSGALEFMWTIPDSVLYYHIIRNAPKYLLDKECSDLAKFTLLMESGELLNWVKKENGEKIDAVIKIQEVVS
jgi:hypothetical protein